MRITQSAMTRQYLNNLNRNLNNMNKSNNKITSTKKFSRASEDPQAAARAFKIRRSLAQLERNESVLNASKGVIEAADEVTMKITNLINQVYEKTLYAANGTQGENEQEIIAQSIETYADDILKLMNTEYAGRYIFGSQNNSGVPFTYGTVTLEDDYTGEEYEQQVVLFNGVNVNSMISPTTYEGVDDYGVDGTFPVPLSGAVYVDIGIGMSLDENGNVNSQSAFDIGFNGTNFMSYGVDENGNPKNIIQIVKDIAAALSNGETEKAVELKDRLEESTKTLLMGIADIGNRESFIDFNLERIEGNLYSIYEAQNNTEGTEIEEEITHYNILQLAYNATLQMSSRVIPRSIFDFI